MPRTTEPGFYKGDIVTPRPARPGHMRRYGTRTATQAEKDAWYAAHPGHDDAGESYVHDGSTGVLLTDGAHYTVLRGRCTAYTGWMTRSGYAEVQATDGSIFKIDRSDVMLVKS